MQPASQSPWRHLPNAVSLLRIVLIAPIAWQLLQRCWIPALCLIAVAGASDGLDGFLARHYGWRSRLGGMLDASADKLLLVTCFVLLAWLDITPLWLAWVVCGRDLMIAAGALLWRLLVGPIQPQPSMLSKVCTVMQILYLLDVLFLQAGWLSLPSPPLGWAVAVLCGASWLDYAVRWSVRARLARRLR
ncbi:CDP-alcohol phosphatidyltransferase family protein [Dyella sp. A6]|uniref:CDP-alcohol phosphatidyltransferase family protein n=1 Tax=Dyella aluminiiresistens TaxID=3069105 RepID=UPI002E7A1129|nr:CDP-alcohol phosphatidyltransferase family protein [Dyella sp. A6]